MSEWAQSAGTRWRRGPRERRVVRFRGISVSGPKPSLHRFRHPEGTDLPQLSVGRAWGACQLPGCCSAPSSWGPVTQLLRERGKDIRGPPLGSQWEKPKPAGGLVRSPAGPAAISLMDSFVRPRAKEQEGAGSVCFFLLLPGFHERECASLC